jgi:hypothetical protein
MTSERENFCHGKIECLGICPQFGTLAPLEISHRCLLDGVILSDVYLLRTALHIICVSE